jgi:trk/ktr system potassium uptake protein
MKAKKKYICVVGLGQFGGELARNLAEHCEVLAVDSDETKVNKITDLVQRALILDARDYDSLSSVVTSDFDEAVISLGEENTEASILCTLHMKKIGVPEIRVKASNDDHATILRAVGATETIFPERDTAHRLASMINNPNLLDLIPLEEDYMIMDVAPPDQFIGKNLLQLKLRKKYNTFVIAIKEIIPPNFIFLPGPDFVIKPSDILVTIGRETDLYRFKDDLSKPMNIDED